MFNDTSSLKSHLATRRSGKARDMVAPGPDADELRAIIELALRTPDHGKLAPWRIVTIAGDQRERFAGLLKEAWVAENPGAAGMDLSALDQFAHQAPSLVVLISTPVPFGAMRSAIDVKRVAGIALMVAGVYLARRTT